MTDVLEASSRFPSRIDPAPERWRDSCANSESTLHQLSPYIGKIKSSIAGELIDDYSQRDDLIVDPFAGAGTIPLEAVFRGRRSFASDISPYAGILCLAKLAPPPTLAIALHLADRALLEASHLPRPNLRNVPDWVVKFFHSRTLCEAVQFAEIARRPGNEFLMACFLGILHHQRPGFLSYPSSHLVPYLRDKKYPRVEFPAMYDYRDLRSRLLAKIRRTYRRFTMPLAVGSEFTQSAIEHLEFPTRFDALITSPPYMNALDYGRDNRLRLWFANCLVTSAVDNDVTQQRSAFRNAISTLAGKVEIGLRPKGHCVFIVGEAFRRTYEAHPSVVVCDIMRQHAPSTKLVRVIADDIPDVRRTRRECRGVKTEHFLVFQRE